METIKNKNGEKMNKVITEDQKIGTEEIQEEWSQNNEGEENNEDPIFLMQEKDPKNLDPINIKLTNILKEFRPLNWVQDQVFLQIPVANLKGYYPGMKLNEIQRSSDYLREFGKTSKKQDNYSYYSYECKNYAISGQVEEELIRDSKMNPIHYLYALVKQLYFRLNLQREIQASKILQDDTFYTHKKTYQAASNWEKTTTKVVQEVYNAKYEILKITSMFPNHLILSQDVYEVLQKKQEILEYVKYSGKGVVDLEGLARIFGVKKVLVGNTYYVNESNVQKSLWSKTASLIYVPEEYSLPSFSVAYQRNEYPKAYQWRNEEGGRIYSYAVVDSYDLSIMNKDLGFLFKNLI